MSRVFLSCVTKEFGSHRALLAKDLRRARVDVAVQEDFGVRGRTLLEALDDYIAKCDAVIHLIGDVTGESPEHPAVEALLNRHPELEKVAASYTQWEAYLAIHHKRPLHV
jgi:hypothetical protein